MNESSPFALPRLKEVFEHLRRGRHLCPEDGDLYRAVHDHQDAFRDLFFHLGFDLKAHHRGFFYFHGQGSLSDTGARMAVFMFILLEAMGDQGKSVEEELMTATFTLADMPHLNGNRYRAYMKEAGIDGEEGLELVIRNMERFGFLQRLREGVFRFRIPVYRFLDLCHEILAEAQGDEKEELDS